MVKKIPEFYKKTVKYPTYEVGECQKKLGFAVVHGWTKGKAGPRMEKIQDRIFVNVFFL